MSPLRDVVYFHAPKVNLKDLQISRPPLVTRMARNGLGSRLRSLMATAYRAPLIIGTLEKRA